MDRTAMICEPEREVNGAVYGSTRRWGRTIQGQMYSFTAVLMPSGERRYFASKLSEGQDGRFGSSWKRCFELIIKP